MSREEYCAFLARLAAWFAICFVVVVPLMLAPTYTDEGEQAPYRANMAVIEVNANACGNVLAADIDNCLAVIANRQAAKDVIESALFINALIDTVEPEAEYPLQLEYAGEFYITMYAATVEQCGNDLGITASGRKCTDDATCHTVAVDPAVIPLGTYLIIEGYDGIIFRADDTGSAINGYDIDIFTTSEAESKTFNNLAGVKVWIIVD